MDNARSVWAVLLALLFVFLIWAWATGRAKKIFDGIKGTAAAQPGPIAASANSQMNGAGLTPPSFVTPPKASDFQTQAPITSGGAFNIPSFITTPTQGLTLPTIPSLQMPVPSNVNRPARSSLLTLPQYQTTSQIPSGGLFADLANAFGFGRYVNPSGSGTTYVDVTGTQQFSDIIQSPPSSTVDAPPLDLSGILV